MAIEKKGSTVLVLDSATLGRGNDELGAMLIPNFLRAIAFMDDVPDTVVCYNTGVKLCEEGSAGVPMLQAMAEKGSEIILCGTCVDFFKIKERLAVGKVGDMRGIVDAQMRADRLIRS